MDKTGARLQDLVEWIDSHRVINASGTMTDLGASSVSQDVAEVMARILPYFIDMAALQALASRWIARVTKGEAGCVTACAASGIAVSVAATMTGLNLGAIEALPDCSSLTRTEVVIQKGHVVNFGASVAQMIRIAGAKVVEVGSTNSCGTYQLRHALSEKTAAGVYVVSHHTVQSGLISLPDFVRVCHERGVPVIVDAASEYDLQGFIELGADLVVYSAHKFLAGPTAGIIAGRKSLVRACYLNQVAGIGRAMKVGKESIAGAIAALIRWIHMDHRAVHMHEYNRVERLVQALRSLRGLKVEEVPDPTGNPITRVRVWVDELEAGMSAEELARVLRSGRPSIAVRAHHVDLGFFELDPCNLLEGDLEVIVERFTQVLAVRGKPVQAGHVGRSSETTKMGFGPRFSRYSESGLPRVDQAHVPWAFQGRNLADLRAEALLAWPDAYDEPDRDQAD